MGEEEVKKKRNVVLVVLVICAILFFACTIAINSSLNEIEPLRTRYHTEKIIHRDNSGGNINLVVMPQEITEGVSE